MRVATIKVHEKSVVERREKEWRHENRERSRNTILPRDAAMSCVSQKKITALESDPRLWKLFVTPLPFSWLAPASDLVSRRPLPRNVPSWEIMHALVRNSADVRHGSVACLISQGWETREISELSTSLIKIAHVGILPGSSIFHSYR